MLDPQLLAITIQRNVVDALTEDLGHNDPTAQLVAEHTHAHAQVICRENAVLCGQHWFEAVFRLLDPNSQINWLVKEGDNIAAGQLLCELTGNARALLSAERTALNFLQTLSATASITRRYVNAINNAIGNASCLIMDTRKTLPGLRVAQKYAVLTGGGNNQRMGLWDGILIKENHIAAAGSIANVLAMTRNNPLPVQIEVENLAQLQESLDAGATLILLDNFNLPTLRQAVQITAGRATLEASGGIDLDNIAAVAATGVQRISIGALTKHVQATDLSMRIVTHAKPDAV
jgi:nicotinate-nucleotide pyrophosphorylase (carboxylating)